ncbi:hypothetical protein [Snuella lapsa]|uniref:Uncharacterized protein n=1 Tax=Snuella lapsa TaxID=870481 RepID=A0ABP6WQ63_9FLAO
MSPHLTSISTHFEKIIQFDIKTVHLATIHVSWLPFKTIPLKDAGKLKKGQSDF